MVKKALPILFLLLLLASCNRKEFSILYEDLVLTRRDDASQLELVLALSDPSADYTVSVSSPSGLLSWDAALAKDGEDFFRAKLDITPGARFEKGIYNVSIVSCEGTGLDTQIVLDYEDVDVFIDDEGLLRTGGRVVAVTFSDGEEKELFDGAAASDADYAFLQDGSGNRFYFTLSYPPSP